MSNPAQSDSEYTSVPNHTATDTDSLLDTIQHRAFDFFWNEANTSNGLVKDRANNFKRDDYQISSIASVGFGLAALPVAVERGWVSRDKALKRATNTLRFFAREAEHKKGFFYHFLGMTSGKRVSDTEISSIDTAILLAGAVTAREYFKDPKITEYVKEIYDRIDFQWMMNKGKTFSMGWKPASGFIKERWSDYNEGILLVLLAIGADGNAISSQSWNDIFRKKGVYKGITIIQSPPLFTHQYPQLFFDLRDKHDEYADYFKNSVNVTKCNYFFCMNHAQQYKTFEKGYWGLTACDGPLGYKAYGAKPGAAVYDGTVAPTAALTSIMFTPELSIKFMKKLYVHEKGWLWGRYGFVDAFNLDSHWKSPDVIGIDQGAILLGIENYRTGLIWKLFSQSPESIRALEKIGFKPGTKEITLPVPPEYTAVEKNEVFSWDGVQQIDLSSRRLREVGEIDKEGDLYASIQFAWDSTYLYFKIMVRDDSLVTKNDGDKIYNDDCLELFVNPEGGSLEWGNVKDFQIGFSPDGMLEKVKVWSWFQNQDPTENDNIVTDIIQSDDGYSIDGKVTWKYLGIIPKKGKTIRLSPAFHDSDNDNTQSKYNWYFFPVGEGYELGRITLE